jgi:hypothetical protein
MERDALYTRARKETPLLLAKPGNHPGCSIDARYYKGENAHQESNTPTTLGLNEDAFI